MKKLLSNAICLSLLTSGFATDLKAADPYANSGGGVQYEKGFDGTQNMTDEEVIESQEYIHQGKAQRELDEKCLENEVCTRSADFAFKKEGWQKVEAMAPIASQILSLVFSISGDISMKEKTDEWKKAKGREAKKKLKTEDKKWAENKVENGEEATNKTENKTDICNKIPVVAETAAGAMQMLEINQIERNLDEAPQNSRQAETLYALANTHEQRKKAARVQALGWSATAGCYGVYMAKGAVIDTKFIAKLAGSTLLGTFYWAKVAAHNESQKEIEGIAKSLPGAGDCNPHTKTSCFCQEETSAATDPQNYKKYCMPPEYGDRNPDKMASVCVDKNGKADTSCECKKTNSCIDKRLSGMATRIGIPLSLMKNPLNGIKPLSSGLIGANTNAANKNNMAMARQALDKALKDIGTPSIKLNSKQKGLARDLAAMGLPNKAAAIMASQATPQSTSNIPSGFTSPVASIQDSGLSNEKAQNTLKKVGYGNARGVRKNTKSRSGKKFDPFARFKSGKDKGQKDSSIEIDGSYAERATQEATITKNTGRPIFDIISYRYKASAWKKFESNLQEAPPEEKE
jgi:hypothetical protein